MVDSKEGTGERLGERASENRDERNESVDRWEAAMSSGDVPEFTGEWGYGSLPESGLNETEAEIAADWDSLAEVKPSDLEREWQEDEKIVEFSGVNNSEESEAA